MAQEKRKGKSKSLEDVRKQLRYINYERDRLGRPKIRYSKMEETIKNRLRAAGLNPQSIDAREKKVGLQARMTPYNPDEPESLDYGNRQPRSFYEPRKIAPKSKNEQAMILGQANS